MEFRPTVRHGIEMIEGVLQEMQQQRTPRAGELNPYAFVRWRTTLHQALEEIKQARELAQKAREERQAARKQEHAAPHDPSSKKASKKQKVRKTSDVDDEA